MTQTLSETEVNEEPQEEPEILLPNTTIVTHCILKNDIPRFAKCFEDDTDPYKETITELLNTRDDDGKAPLDVASTLGRTEMIKELIQRGADVSSVTARGKLQFRCFFFFFFLLGLRYNYYIPPRFILSEQCINCSFRHTTEYSL